jgi:diguanylate cyclase (GGDEF)-like protein/PAS domain S-box-containing protein
MKQKLSVRKKTEARQKQQKKSKKSTEKMLETAQSIIESIPESILVIDKEYRITLMNKAAREFLFGFPSPSGLLTCYQCHHKREAPCDETEIRCPLRGFHESREPATVVHEHYRSDGKKCFLEIITSPLWSKEGTFQGVVEIARDITEQKMLQDLISQGKREWEETFDIINDAITIHDRNFNVIRANKTAEKLLGLPFSSILGQKCYRLFHGMDSSPKDCASCQAMKTGKPSTTEIFEPHLGKFIEIKAFPLFDKDNQIIKLVHVIRDITERKLMEDALKHQAYHDLLTGLPNRMLFMEHLSFGMTRARRNQKMLAVLFLDLDHFKDINDSMGHTVGDYLLKEVARRLKTCIRESDTVGRMGGDEFTILLSDITHADDALVIVKKIMAIFQETFPVDGRELHTTTSIGISLYPKDGEHAEDLLKNADRAMYHAKEQGRNTYQFFNAAMDI